MKNTKNQEQAQKRSLSDFEHCMTVQLKEKYYIDYAMAHSKEQIKTNRKKALLWAALFVVLGLIALYKGTSMEGRWADVYLTGGLLLIIFQLFNLFHHFVMFPIALKQSVCKELKKDPSLLMPMEYAFEPDKLVCFMDGKHRNTVMTEDIFGVEDTEETIILQVKNGKRVIIPKASIEQADDVIKKQLESFRR